MIRTIIGSDRVHGDLGTGNPRTQTENTRNQYLCVITSTQIGHSHLEAILSLFPGERLGWGLCFHFPEEGQGGGSGAGGKGPLSFRCCYC